jgi:hypothetical protein
MPVEARGFFSGILQQGYAVGYLLAAVLNLTEETRDQKRTVHQHRGASGGQRSETHCESRHSGSKGFFSGILQQGYAVGYLLAAVLNLTEVAKHGNWRVACESGKQEIRKGRFTSIGEHREASAARLTAKADTLSAFSCPSLRPLSTVATPRRRAEPSSLRERRVAFTSIGEHREASAARLTAKADTAAAK